MQYCFCLLGLYGTFGGPTNPCWSCLQGVHGFLQAGPRTVFHVVAASRVYGVKKAFQIGLLIVALFCRFHLESPSSEIGLGPAKTKDFPDQAGSVQ